MVQKRFLSLDFLEGIIVGIYGNWLISLIDKIDFANLPLHYYILLLVSFGFFVGYFYCMIFREHAIEPFVRNALFTGFHCGAWLVVYLDYGKGNPLEKLLFGFIGVFLFITLQATENKRVRELLRTPRKPISR